MKSLFRGGGALECGRLGASQRRAFAAEPGPSGALCPGIPLPETSFSGPGVKDPSEVALCERTKALCWTGGQRFSQTFSFTAERPRRSASGRPRRSRKNPARSARRGVQPYTGGGGRQDAIFRFLVLYKGGRLQLAERFFVVSPSLDVGRMGC